MKHILMLATGGTIASKKTNTGLTPSLLSEQILEYVPRIKTFCNVTTIQLCNIDSTNMSPEYWVKIAKAIEENYNNYDGFVILHGTDTMAYTAAALSYMIQYSKKPIVLTGAQKPIDVDITDAKANLFDSFVYACDDSSHGVTVVFGGQAIAGTRAKKIRTKSYNAFSSINFPNKAVLHDGKIIRYITNDSFKETPDFYTNLDEKIYVLKLIPGTDAKIFQYLKEHYSAIVIESFGVGGLPMYGNNDFSDALADWLQCGKTIIMTTQVPYEGSDMETYRVGYKIKEKYELIEAYDMPLEAVVTKAMWILGQTNNQKKVKELFYTPVNFDILR